MPRRTPLDSEISSLLCPLPLQITDPPKANFACGRALRTLQKQIESLNIGEFGYAELQSINIRPSLASFDTPNPDFSPCFFKPYPPDLLTPPRAIAVSTVFPGYNEYMEGEDGQVYFENAEHLEYHFDNYLLYHESLNDPLEQPAGYWEELGCYRE